MLGLLALLQLFGVLDWETSRLLLPLVPPTQAALCLVLFFVTRTAPDSNWVALVPHKVLAHFRKDDKTKSVVY